MSKISKLLLKTYTGPFIITFLVAILIFEMQFLWVYVDDLMGKGLKLSLIIQLLVYASARLVSLALPLAILMSSIMTMGTLAENYELTSMKSAGIGLLRILRPLIVLMIFVSFGAFFFANNVWPIANLKFRTLLYSITHQQPTLSLDEGIFYDGIEGYNIRVSSKSKDGSELFDVLIYDHRYNKGNYRIIRAERGTMAQTEDKRNLIMTLYNGYSYSEELEKRKVKNKVYPYVRSHFEKDIIRIDLSSLLFEEASEDIFAKAHEMMTIEQLDEATDSMDVRLANKRKDIHRYLAKNIFYKRDSVVFNEMSSSNDGLSSIYYFDKLSRVQQARVFEVAKKATRSQKDYIFQAKNDIYVKELNRERYVIEYHRKFLLAFSCIVLFFIGAPLGAIIRKGGLGFPTVIALGFFVFYHILTVIGEKMVRIGTIDGWLGMWMSSFVLFPIGVFLTYKAANDSSIMDKDAYIKVWNKFTGVFRKKSNG